MNSFQYNFNELSFVPLNIEDIFNGALELPKKEKISNIPFYEISIGSASGTEKVINHCSKLLQGYKYFQLAAFIQKSKVFQDKMKEFFEK